MLITAATWLILAFLLGSKTLPEIVRTAFTGYIVKHALVYSPDKKHSTGKIPRAPKMLPLGGRDCSYSISNRDHMVIMDMVKQHKLL